MRFKAIALAAALWITPIAALAQSSPGLINGQVPTAAEWNSFFAAKTDYTGTSPIPSGGGTFTGKVNFFASTTGTAGMNCGVGATPTTPVNGDIWCTSAGMFVQINGGTVGPLGAGAGGTIAVTGGGTGQTSFTANLPILGNGTGALAQGTRSGNTTAFATASGTLTSGHCVSIDGGGNFVDAGGACTTGGGGGTVASSTIGQVAVYTGTTTVTGLTGCNSGYFGTNGGGTVSCQTSLLAALQASITQVGTIATGVWNGTVIGATYGGTGVNNGSDTITLGGNFATSGAAITLTAIGATNITLPTSGNIPNSAGTSGGVPYYNTSSTIASSAALTANLPIFGGGAGSAPFSGTRLGNTTKAQMANSSTTPVTGDCVSYDANGNTQDSGQPCGGANAAPVLLATLTCTGASCTDVGSACGASGCFTSTYPTYTIKLINMIASSPASNVGCQIAAYIASTYQTSGYVSAYGAFTATAYIPCFPAGQSGLGANTMGAPGLSGIVTVFNPNPASSPGKAMWQGVIAPTTGTTGAPLMTSQGTFAALSPSGAVTGFRMCFSTSASACGGSINISSGTIEVYGNP